jgi:hypothetical protein
MQLLNLFKKPEVAATVNETVEYSAKQVLFNFNKKHLEDPIIPMWMLTFSGEQYYVNHVDCRLPWSTRERPEHHSTKGTIILKNCLVTIDNENCATITELSEHDKIRLRNREKGITRIIIPWASSKKVTDVLKNNRIKHGPIKTITGACTSTFYVTDILDKKHMTMLTLSLDTNDFRILKENESYYKMYDDPKYKDHDEIDEDEYYWDSEDEDEEDA